MAVKSDRWAFEDVTIEFNYEATEIEAKNALKDGLGVISVGKGTAISPPQAKYLAQDEDDRR